MTSLQRLVGIATLFLVAALPAAKSTLADEVTISFTADVNTSTDAFFSIGSNLSGFTLYDTDTPGSATTETTSSIFDFTAVPNLEASVRIDQLDHSFRLSFATLTNNTAGQPNAFDLLRLQSVPEVTNATGPSFDAVILNFLDLEAEVFNSVLSLPSTFATDELDPSPAPGTIADNVVITRTSAQGSTFVTGSFTSVSILSGGGGPVVNPDGDLILGDGAAGNSLTLNDGDMIMAQTTVVGESETAEITQNGGRLVTQELKVGGNDEEGQSGEGTYNLNGGELVTRRSRVGVIGRGGFSQTGGNHSVSESLSVGRNDGTTSGVGSYEISDGTLTVEEDIDVGVGSNGEAAEGEFIQTGGRAEARRIRVAERAAAQRRNAYRVRGGTTTASEVQVGLDDNAAGEAILEVSDDGVVEADVSLGRRGVLTGNNGTIRGNVRARGGRIAPGSSPGIMTIDGDLEMTDGGLLDFEIAGIGDGMFDVLDVTGDVILTDVVMQFTFIDDFLPELGDRFDLLRFDGALTTDMLSFSVLGLETDFGFDFLFTDGLFSLVTNMVPDGSGGGTGGGGSTAVPEPSSLALFLVALFAFAFLRRYGNRNPIGTN